MTPRPTLAERLDSSHYRDDVLRLLFICCHPDLPATQQIALALRIVSGLTVKEIARAFLVSEAAMEQRITRAKRQVGAANVPFETPGAIERAERLATVAAMIYLRLQRGLFRDGRRRRICARTLCEEAIRLARLLLRLFPERAGDHGPHRPAAAAACAHAGAARCGGTHRAARGAGPRACGTAT